MKKLQSNLGDLREQVVSTEGIVWVLGNLCLISAVGFAHAMGRNVSAARNYAPPEVEAPTPELNESASEKPPLTAYNTISSRNIFGVSKSTAPVAATPTAQATSLKLRLVGTNIRSRGNPLAIIEDTAKKNQEVFGLNEAVFDQAKIVEILPDKVKLDRNGRLEVLELEDENPTLASAQSGPGEDAAPPGDDQTQFNVPESELESALANLPQLLSQARAVPYFRNNQSIGMRLFAIRRGSLYEKLGLKNGDILKAVNNNSLSDPTQALKLFEQLKTERNIQVKVERGGQDLDLSYSIN